MFLGGEDKMSSETKKSIFCGLRRRLAGWILAAVMLFLVTLFVMLYFSFSKVICDDGIEKAKKFSEQSVWDVEQKLGRIENLIDESISKYIFLKTSSSEGSYYGISYLLSDIRKAYYVATDYELNTFTYLDGRVDIYYGDSGRSEDLGRFISERYDDILKSLAQNGVYYTCMDDEIFCIKQTPLQNEGCLLGVQIPSRLFTKSIYNSKNIFLKAVNIFISFNDGEIMQIDMGNKLFSNTKTAEKYITSGFETYDNKGIIITGKNIKNNNYTIIAIQNTDFVTEIKTKIIVLLLIAFLIIFFVCVILFKRIVSNIISPMDDLYMQMNNYGKIGGERNV